MKIADGVEMLTLEAFAFGQKSLIHPVLIKEGAEAWLIDAGLPGQLEAIRASVTRADVPSKQMKGIIVTHQDIDHCGCVPEMMENWGSPLVIYAHELDRPYLDGSRHPIKMDLKLMGDRLRQLPDHIRSEVERMCQHPPVMHVDRDLKDREELAIGGGIIVLHTPGHTPGHISLYLRQSRTLIAADALECREGELRGPNPHNTLDMEAAILSLQSLLQFPIDRIISYHGGLCDKDAEGQLRRLIPRIKRSSQS